MGLGLGLGLVTLTLTLTLALSAFFCLSYSTKRPLSSSHASVSASSEEADRG